MANKRLNNNPLFREPENREPEEFDVEKERKALGIEVSQEGAKKLGRPRNENLVRDNAAQDGLPADWTRATFIIQKDKLEFLRDYAYTERITLKEALDQALDLLIENTDTENLLPHR